MLYIGAGHDTYPLTYPHKTFIYVDAIPNLPHYTKDQHGYRVNHNLDVFREELIRLLKLHHGFQSEEVMIPDKYYKYTIVEGKFLHYFVNTMDTEIGETTELKTFLPSVDTVYIKGYSPHVSIWKTLPKSVHIYTTSICFYDIPEEMSENVDGLYDYYYDDEETDDWVFLYDETDEEDSDDDNDESD